MSFKLGELFESRQIQTFQATHNQHIAKEFESHPLCEMPVFFMKTGFFYARVVEGATLKKVVCG
ncbi:MAG: hypothetical protein BGO21_06010 [Dyadobacter sp. 50-39]|nr:MAG: hypothetical protein BGO21_06010 [Dyadobacter sp. 50-39]